MSNANDRQVAGNHYREIAEKAGAPQHWDLMWALYGEAWFVGCITKYVLRYKKKNGVEDLKKAQHYLEKLIELEQTRLDAKKQPEPAPVVPLEVIRFVGGDGTTKHVEFGTDMLCKCQCVDECPRGNTEGLCTLPQVRDHLRSKE